MPGRPVVRWKLEHLQNAIKLQPSQAPRLAALVQLFDNDDGLLDVYFALDAGEFLARVQSGAIAALAKTAKVEVEWIGENLQAREIEMLMQYANDHGGQMPPSYCWRFAVR